MTSLSEHQQKQIEQYLDLLIAANEKMNLTRIVDRDDARVRHIQDSLTLLPFFPSTPFRLADVGSGGGAPGMVLAIARPDAQVVLIESTKKKAGFLREAAAQLELKNVRVIDQRVEEVARDIGRAYRESFDIVTARAVATMVWLVEWCLPLTKVGGKMLAMKGPKVRDELAESARAVRLVGGAEPLLHAVTLPGTDEHLIVEIKKISRSHAKYPRDPTIAKGEPI